MLRQRAIHLVNPDGSLGNELIGLGQIQWNNKNDDYGSVTFDLFPFVHEPTAKAVKLGIQVALTVNSLEQTGSRFWLSDSQQTIISPTGYPLVQTWQGVSVRWLLSKAPLRIPAVGEPAVDITLTGNPGQLLAGPFADAQAAGFLTWLDRDWNGTEDSYNAPWDAATVRTVTFKPAATLVDLLDWLQYDQQLVDVKFRQHNFRMFAFRSSSDDYATPAPGLPQVVLRAGQIIQQGDRTGSAREMANVGIAIGSDGRWALREDAGSIAEYDKLLEFEQSGGLTTQGDINKAAQLLVDRQNRSIAYKGYGLRFDDALGQPRGPYIDGGWTIDDKVLIEDGVAGVQAVRIPSITLTWPVQGGEPACVIEADTRLVRKAERIERRLASLVTGGPTGPVPDAHRVPPAAPTDLVLATSVDVPPAGGQTRAKVTGSVTPSTEKADGEDLLEPIDRLEVRWRYTGLDRWSMVLAEPDGTFVLDDLKPSRAGATIGVEVEVRAYDKAGPSDPVTGSIDTVAVREYVAYDDDGNEIVRIEDGDWFYEKVEGGALAATGPGVRHDSDVGSRFWGDSGALKILLERATGDAYFAGDVYVQQNLYVSGYTEIDDVLDVLADTNVYGEFTVWAGGVPVLIVDASGATLIGELEAGGITIADDVIDFDGAHSIAYTGSDLVFSAASGFIFDGAATFNDTVNVNASLTANGLYSDNDLQAAGEFGCNGSATSGRITLNTAASDPTRIANLEALAATFGFATLI